MSTRCTINFGEGTQVEAKIYRHCDGYPEGDNGVLADLQRFFADVESQTKDTRFGDPSYLAAKFVVWQAYENANVGYTGPLPHRAGTPNRLDFLSLGIMAKDPSDIEYRYFVDSGKLDEKGRPTVRQRKARQPA